MEAARRFRDIKPSPRMRLAAMLYATGAARSKREAAKIAELAPSYFTEMTKHNDEVRRIVGETQTRIEDEAISTSALIQRAGRKALGRLMELMESEKEEIALRAAVDLADRAPDTQKTQRVQVDQFTIGAADAKELAAALVESARMQRDYAHIALEGLDEIEVDERPSQLRLEP